MRINAAFDGAKIEMGNLRVSLHEINDALAAGRLVSSDRIAGFVAAANRYLEQVSALESVGAELSIPIGEDVKEIDRAIMQYKQKIKDQCTRGPILDYFRLNTEVDDVKQALEDSKRRLAEKCAFGGEELFSAIEACRILLAHIRSDDRRLSDEQHDLGEKHIGKPIARAAGRYDLSIDENCDISIYLDESCAILATEREKDDERGEGASSTSMEGEPREDGMNVEPVESNTGTEPLDPEQNALLPGWPCGIATATSSNYESIKSTADARKSRS